MADQLKNGIPPAISDGKGRTSGLARRFLQELAEKALETAEALANLSLATISGVLPIVQGGTGQITQTAAFDALDPLTTKGDLIVHNGTNSVRQAVGANNTIVVADSAQANGLKWLAFESLPHGDRVRVISAASGQRNFPSNTTFTDGPAFVMPACEWQAPEASASDRVLFPLDLLVGDRIKSVKIYGRTGGASAQFAGKVWKRAMTSAAASQLGTTQTTSNGGTADDSVTISGLTETVVAGTQYFAEFQTSGITVANRMCYGLELTYDRP